MTEQEMRDKLRPHFDALVEIMLAHEQEDHNGERCSDERSNVVAYFAHKLMLTVDEWVRCMDLFGEYLDEHNQHKAEGH